MIDNHEEVEDFLAHYGVKGMKWGVRRERPDGVSARTNRDARKDANEFSRAKMFYGEGAGTRRKLIKATVEAKSKKDPSYKKAFDHHLNAQDLSKHASKARSERRRKDVTSTTTKTARGVYRSLTGGFGSVSIASATIAGAYLYAKQTGADKVVMDSMSKTIKDVRQNVAYKKSVRDFMKNNGFG